MNNEKVSGSGNQESGQYSLEINIAEGITNKELMQGMGKDNKEWGLILYQK